jgi:hypothetical protein
MKLSEADLFILPSSSKIFLSIFAPGLENFIKKSEPGMEILIRGVLDPPSPGKLKSETFNFTNLIKLRIPFEIYIFLL